MHNQTITPELLQLIRKTLPQRLAEDIASVQQIPSFTKEEWEVLANHPLWQSFSDRHFKHITPNVLGKLMNNYTGICKEEFIQRFKQRLMDKWNKTSNQSDLWIYAMTDIDIAFLMQRFYNNPELAADDDFQYAE